MSSRKLKIVCFACNWVFCDRTQTAIDAKQKVPFDVDVVRVMCIGRIDPVIILEMFQRGADGVLLVGCTPPDCHFVEGNLYAERIVVLVKRLLSLTSLGPERLELRWSSPTEDTKLVHVLTDFASQIEKFGASPLLEKRTREGALLNIAAAKNAAAEFRLRVLTGRERELTENVNVYGEKVSAEELDALVDEIVKVEFVRQKIHLLTKQKTLSVKELAAIIHMEPALVLRHIVDMRRIGMVALDRVEGTTPFYRALEV